MIVAHQDLPARRMRVGGPEATWRCLARRGMLHSECESFEQVRLVQDAELAHDPRNGMESVVYVAAGSGELIDEAGTRPLGAGTVLLAPARAALRVRARDEGLDLIVLRSLPAEVITRLPARVPELPAAEQTPVFRSASAEH
ncbi:hypothetical protein ACPXCE_10650 [Streptomyces sp. DT24]|uniref:hypothetical protein n=1 Tax=unclassified Streptomyces TaxID=2593676 RepID=UPI0023BA315B|nr:hypothetical protein [Streptomyces sp. AM 4-1-1]WEH34591.1 hypothetical protein PZB75_15300 [Streptomyces sp. AM 4-1-1]